MQDADFIKVLLCRPRRKKPEVHPHQKETRYATEVLMCLAFLLLAGILCLLHWMQNGTSPLE